MSPALFILGGAAGLIGALVGAYVSLRTVKPAQDKIIAETGKLRAEADAIARTAAGEEYSRMLDRYREIVADQDTHIADCEHRIDELVEARRLWLIERNELIGRITRMEGVLRRHGLNGDST